MFQIFHDFMQHFSSSNYFASVFLKLTSWKIILILFTRLSSLFSIKQLLLSAFHAMTQFLLLLWYLILDTWWLMTDFYGMQILLFFNSSASYISLLYYSQSVDGSHFFSSFWNIVHQKKKLKNSTFFSRLQCPMCHTNDHFYMWFISSSLCFLGFYYNVSCILKNSWTNDRSVTKTATEG